MTFTTFLGSGELVVDEPGFVDALVDTASGAGGGGDSGGGGRRRWSSLSDRYFPASSKSKCTWSALVVLVVLPLAMMVTQ